MVSSLNALNTEAATRVALVALEAESLGGWTETLTECGRVLARERRPAAVTTLLTAFTRKRHDDPDFLDVLRARDRLLEMLDATDAPFARSWDGMAKLLVFFRNKTRGHGARSAIWQDQAGDDLSFIAERLLTFVAEFDLHFATRATGQRFYLLRGDCSNVVSLDGEDLPDTVLVAEPDRNPTVVGAGTPLFLPIPSEELFFFANGNLRTDLATAEYLEYLKGATRRIQIPAKALRSTPLPTSHTAGRSALQHSAQIPHNLPHISDLWISRPGLEKQLRDVLIQPQYPIVTLHGIGGSGKTALALRVASEFVEAGLDRFEVVLWLSSRDIDLLPNGIVETQPEVSTLSDMADLFCRLMDGFIDPSDSNIETFRRELAEPTWRYLIIADNFETLEDPEGVQKFLADTALAPTKVLITSRNRAFAADLPITVDGLEVDQANELINREARSRYCEGLLTDDIRERFIKFTDRRPYPLKLAVALLAANVHPHEITERLRSDKSVLEALFRRSYDVLPKEAKYFALLVGNSNGRVSDLLGRVAVARRGFRFTDAEQPAVAQAVINRISYGKGQYGYTCPYTAREFLRMEAALSELEDAVREDVAFVREYRGITERGDRDQGVRIAREIAGRILAAESADESTSDLVDILERLAGVEPAAFVHVADVRRAVGEDPERQIEALRTGLEIDLDQPKLWIAWSEIERDRRDYRRSYQLIRQGIDACNSLEGISEIIGHFLALSSENQVKTAAFRGNLDRYPAADAAIRALEAFGDELNGDQLGMLAWLYRLRGKPRDALDTVFTGLRLEPHNPHLLNLESRLREENPDLFGQSTE